MKNLKVTGIMGFLLQLIMSCVTVFVIAKNNILPNFYFALMVVLLLLLLMISGVFVIARSKPRVVLGVVFSFLITILLGVVSFEYYLSISTLNKITSRQDTYISTYYVVVKKDDSAMKPIDIKEYLIGIEKSHDFEAMKKALEKIAEEYKQKMNFIAYDDYISMWNGFIEHSDTQAILMETNYYEIFRESYEEDNDDINNYVRIIGEIDVEMRSDIDEDDEDKKDTSSQAFVVYISGIDVEGSINQRSRSDVNIVMAINPDTKKIALVTVPRDSYVQFPGVTGGSYDKLTHAAIYGKKNDCSVSIATLEQNVYPGVDIDYWVRVNFTSLVDIVDVLGGIEAYSAYSYTSTFTGERYYFEKGMNYMDGEKALVFCRERKSIPGEEQQRGRNQLEVIKGIFNKATSPAILANYNDLLKEVEGSFLTNMKTEDITKFIKMQLSDGTSWEFETASVEVDYVYDYCYSMPGSKLCVGIIDENSRKSATDLLLSVING